MKKLLSTILGCFLLSGCGNAQKKEFSKDTFEQKLVAKDSSEISFKKILEKHRGKVTVIEVWASWCGDCVKAMPKVKEMQSNHQNVDYVFISMDKSYEKFLNGIEKHQLVGDHYWATDGMKGSFGKSIDLDWIPRYIILDAKGKIVTYRAIETDFDAINETLNKLKG